MKYGDYQAIRGGRLRHRAGGGRLAMPAQRQGMDRGFSITTAGRILGPAYLILAMLVCKALAEPGLAEPWGAIFSGEHATYHMCAQTSAVGWSVTVSDAIVARGESTNLDLSFPPLRDGVAMAGMIKVQNAAGAFSKPIWLFYRNPYFPVISDLMVYDPVGATAPMLESNGIRHKTVASLNALANASNGVLIVGAGISTAEAKGVAPVLFGAAARGLRILWLAPAAGRMALPGREAPAPTFLEFRDTDVIPASDKRLQAADWRNRSAVASSFQLVGDRRMVEMEWRTAAEGGWCWLAARWPSGGRLVICGLSIVDSWENNPAPRYLLSQWLMDFKQDGLGKENK